MNKVLTIFRMARLDVFRWRYSGRIGIIALFIIMIFDYYLTAVRSFVLNVGVNISLFIYPFLMTSSNVTVFVLIGAIILFCDAPFLTDNQIYMLTRMGRNTWFLSKVLYIAMGSILYMVFTYIVSIILFLPNINLENGWGKVIGTLCSTNAKNEFQIMIGMNYKLLLEYAPMEAIVREMVFGILIVFFIGILLFVLNINLKKEMSIVIVTTIVMFGLLADSLPYIAYFVSITSWLNLTINTKYNYGVLPYQSLTFGILITVNLVGILFAWIGIKRKEIL